MADLRKTYTDKMAGCLSSILSKSDGGELADMFGERQSHAMDNVLKAKEMIKSLQTDPSSVDLNELMKACEEAERGVGAAAMGQAIKKAW